MNKFHKGFLFALLTIIIIGAAKITTDNLKIGRGQDENVTLEFDVGAAANNPKMQYNAGTDALQFSSDGANFFDFGSGSGGGAAGINTVSNGDFESGTANWTASGGSFSDTTAPGEILNGGKSGEWDSNGLGQTLKSDLQNIPNALKGRSCSILLTYVDAGIAAGDYVLKVQDQAASDLLPLNESGNPELELEPVIGGVAREAFAAFICPATGSTGFQVVLESTVADAASIIIDDVQLGSNFKAGVVDGKITAWQSYTPSTTQGFGTITNNTLQWRRVGESIEVKGGFNAGTTVASVAALGLPNDYTVDLISAGTGGEEAVVGKAYRDAVSNTIFQVLAFNAENFVRFSRWNRLADENPLGSTNGNSLLLSSDRISINFSVPVLEFKGTGTTETVTLETQNWFMDARIQDGSSITALPASRTIINDTDYVSSLGPANTASVKQLCFTTTSSAAIGADCGVNEVRGFEVVLPYSGRYDLCVNDFFDVLSGSSAGYQIAKVSLSDTSSIIESYRPDLVVSPTGTSTRIYENKSICHQVNLAAGAHRFAIYAEDGGAGAASIRASADINFRMTMQPTSQNFPQAVALPQDKYQIKIPSSPFNAPGTLATFNNLIIGRRYSVDYFFRCLNDFAADTVEGEVVFKIEHNLANLQRTYIPIVNVDTTGGARDSTTAVGHATFTASSTTVDVDLELIDANISCNASTSVGYATIIEHNHMVETTDF